MIHEFGKNHVSENTSTTETVHISKDRYSELISEIKLLRQEITKLSKANETLHNCWQSAIANHIESESQARAWISRAAFKDSEIGELRRQIEELKEHLNPKEEAA